MSTSRSGRGREVVAWLFRDPRRLGFAVFGAVVAGLVGLFALSSLAPAARPGQIEEGARKTCFGTVSGFAGEFFDTTRSGWVERAQAWVAPNARQQVAAVDPALVPSGPVRVLTVSDDTASCDARVEVTPPGYAPVLVDVVAQRGGIGDAPEWVVTEWTPAGGSS